MSTHWLLFLFVKVKAEYQLTLVISCLYWKCNKVSAKIISQEKQVKKKQYTVQWLFLHSGIKQKCLLYISYHEP